MKKRGIYRKSNARLMKFIKDEETKKNTDVNSQGRNEGGWVVQSNPKSAIQE